MASYHYLQIGNVNMFYRTAGNPTNPVILLLHGFPSASHMFRNLMPILAQSYYVVAPDYPGFGNTQGPSHTEFAYTFEHLTDVVEAFLQKMQIERYAMYVFDYGAPIGFRLAIRHPEQITAIVSQNGNIYHEGLGSKWVARAEYWAHPTPELRRSYRSAFAKETIIGQYKNGTEEGRVSPDGYTLDIAYVNLPGRDEMQSDLIFDYQTNVALYPVFQQYLREHRPPLLAVWGKNDVSFTPVGAESFRRDLPDAEIHFVDSGHFALETNAAEIGKLMLDFLFRRMK
jgi:pimeloyl-ACP methyl ester carboxylesterase